jgi:hypothetical protein
MVLLSPSRQMLEECTRTWLLHSKPFPIHYLLIIVNIQSYIALDIDIITNHRRGFAGHVACMGERKESTWKNYA